MRFEALADAVEQARPITIAVLHGGVYGGATDLALACDFRLGAPATEMFVPAARLGLLFYRSGLERYGDAARTGHRQAADADGGQARCAGDARLRLSRPARAVDRSPASQRSMN